MRHWILLTFLVLALNAQGQTYIDNWILEHKNFKFIHIYDTAVSIDQYYSFLSGLGDIEDLNRTEDEIHFFWNDHSIDMQAQGLKWGNTAIINQYPVEAKGTVQFKDGRYRVILKNIKTDVSAANQGHWRWDLWFTKKRGTQISSGKSDLKILDVFAIDFIGYFTYHQVSEAGDW